MKTTIGTETIPEALTIAKYVVSKCTEENCMITNLQLQGILYFIQLDSLKRTRIPAFSDDIEAWKFGVAVPDVYYYFCGFGALPIISTYEINFLLNMDFYLNRIIEEKREVSTWDLLKEVQDPKKPWAKIYRNGKGTHHIIPIDLIRDIG